VGLVASVDGKKTVRNTIVGPSEKCEELGVELGETLLKAGAYDILKVLYDISPPDK
jgi:hydroxymethylbilane synthase